MAMSDCVLWPKSRNAMGYGCRRVGSRKDGTHRTVLAHRWAWEQANGPIPRGLCVLHQCDNPPCVNVEHLWLGTRGENNRDRDAKRRTGKAAGEDNYNARLTDDLVRRIRVEYASLRGERLRVARGARQQLAARFGVSPGAISDVISRSWRHVA
jgi:hypothetical protein